MKNNSEEGKAGKEITRRTALTLTGASALAPKAFAGTPPEPISEKAIQELVQEIEADPHTDELLNGFLTQTASLPLPASNSLKGVFEYSPISADDLKYSSIGGAVNIAVQPLLDRLVDRDSISQEDLRAIHARDAPPFPYTDTYVYPETSIFPINVLGILHTRDDFLDNGKHALKTIDLYDIVLLERGRFFEALATYAKSRGKEVYYIDYKCYSRVVYFWLCVRVIVQADS